MSPSVASDAASFSAAVNCANSNPTAFAIDLQSNINLTGNTPPIFTSTGTTTITGGTGAFMLTGSATSAGQAQTDLQLNGTGTVILQTTGLAGYSGATLIENGILRAGAINAFSQFSDHTVLAPGTLDLAGFSQTIGSLSGNGNVTLGGNAGTVLTVGTSGKNTTFDGVISGAGGLTLDPSHGYTATGFNTNINFTLTGQNTYSGPTNIDVGFFNLSGGATLGNGAISINASGDGRYGGTLEISNSTVDAPSAIANNVSGVGGILVSGAFANFSGNNTGYAGRIQIDNGTFQLGSDNALNNPNAFAVIDAGGTLDLNGHAATVAAIGDGTSFGANPANVGSIALNGGTLTVGTVNAGQFATDYYSGLITNVGAPGSLVKVGDNTLQLLGQNTYSGGTALNGGTIQVYGPGATQSGSQVSLSIGTGVLSFGGGTLQAENGPLELQNAIVASNGGGTIDNAGNALTLSGTITDDVRDGSLIGNGALTFSNSNYNGAITLLSGTGNSFTGGATIVFGGAVQLGAPNAIGAGSLEVDSGGTLDLGGYNQAVTALTGQGTILNNGGSSSLIVNTLTVASGTFGGSLSDANNGSGSTLALTKIDDGTGTDNGGTLVLSGSNFYSGPTLVSGGTLQAGSNQAFSGTSDVTVQSGATLDLGGFDNTVGSLAGAGLATNNGSSLATVSTGATGLSTTFSGQLADGSAPLGLTLLGGTFTLTGTTNTYSGPTTVNGGTLQAGAQNSFSAASDLSIADGATLDLAGFNNAIGSLAGTGAVTNSGLVGATLTAGTSGASTEFSGQINDGASGTVALDKEGGGVLILSGDNAFSGGTTIGGGTLQIGNGGTTGSLAGDVIDNGALAFNHQDAITFAGFISGSGDLQQNGTGVLTLSSANGFTGSTFINAGTVAIGDPGALGANAVTVAPGATLAFASGLTFANAIVAGPDGTATLDTGVNTTTATGLISGTGALTKAGSGTLILTNDETYQGGTIIAAGTLQVGNGGTTGSILGDIADNGALVFDHSGAATFGGTISGSGSLTQTSSGTLTLTGDNTYSGTTFIDTGTIAVGQAQSLGTGPVVMAGGTTLAFLDSFTFANAIQFAGAVDPTIDTGDNTVTVSSAITGAGALTKAGAGTLILTATNTYVGGTTIAAGTLQLGNGGTSGSIVGNVADSGILSFDRTDAVTFAGAISGGGTLVQAGTGTLILTGANTYTGTTTIAAGALQIGNGGTTGTILGDVVDNGMLSINRTDTVTLPGAISGTGSLRQIGTGTLVLSGAASYTGGTTISAGTLQIGAGGTSGSLTGDVVNNGTLAFNRSDASTYAGSLSGTGALVQVGPGVLTLTGDSIDTGATDVRQGTLLVDGSLGRTAVTVESGATLGGSGLIEGNVTIANGGILAPGDGVGVLQLGGLTLTAGANGSSGSILDYQLGTPSSGTAVTNDRADILGNLVLAGTLDVTDVGGFAAGTYRLFNYDGTLTNNALTIAALPDGLTGLIQTTIANQVNLVIQSATDRVQFWDGATTTGNGTIAGGSGTWTNTLTNWTDANGLRTAAWRGGVAVFAGAGGTVSVSDTIAFQGLQFTSAGYTLTAGRGGLLVPTGDAVVEVDPGLSATIAAPLTGTGSLDKTGTGTLILTAANTYAGGTTIDAGTLQIGNGGASGSIVGNVTDNGALTFARADAVTFDGLISGTGSLTQAGSGTLSLTSLNTYTGLTTIASGTLALTGSGSIAASSGLVDNGTFDISGTTSGTSVTSLSGAGTVVLGGSTLSLTKANDTFAGTIGGTGGLTLQAGAETLSGANTYSGATSVLSGTLQAGSTQAFSQASAFTLGPSAKLELGGFNNGVGSLAGSGTVTNSGATAATLTTGGLNTSTTFSGTLADGTSALGLTKVGVGVFTLSGVSTYSGPTTLSGGTLMAGSATAFSPNSLLAVGAGTTVDLGGFSNAVAALSGTGKVTNSGTTTAALSVGAGGASSVYGGLIADGLAPVGLVKAGAGTLTLTGANTYTGGTTIAGGTLQVGNGGTSGSLVGNVADNVTLAFDRQDAVTFAGAISGTGSLAQTGTGTLTLTGANTYTGGTSIASGTLQVGNGGTSGSLLGPVSNNGLLAFDRQDAVTFSGAIAGTGSLAQIGAGSLTLTGANTYTGGTTIASGTLQVGNGGTTGSLLGNVTDNGALAFNRQDAVTVAGAISGTGSLTQIGTGILTLTGANTYTGGTNIASGTLQVGNGGTTGSLLGNVTDNAALAFNRQDALTFAGAISGTGSLAQTGTGTLTLAGANTYTGATSVLSGILQAGSTQTFSQVSAFTLGPSAKLELGGFSENVGSLAGSGTVTNSGTTVATLTTGGLNTSTTFSGTLADGASVLSLTKVGAGVFTLSGVSTYSGPTTLSGGTLMAGSATAFSPNSLLAIGDGTTVDLGGFSNAVATLSGTGKVTNSGTTTAALSVGAGGASSVYGGLIADGLAPVGLVKAGAGTLTLTGANTYTGGTTIASGTLQVGNGGTTGSLLGNVTDNGLLAFNRQDAVTVAGAISGTGSLAQTGTGTLTLTGANSYTGGTTIASGTLQVGNGGTTGSLLGPIADNGLLAFNRQDAVTFSGAIAGTGSLAQTGTGTLTLTGANTYTGGTTIASGTLQIGNGGTSGSLLGPVADNATLAFNRQDAVDFTGAISGTGSLAQIGTGILTLTGANTYIGGTNIASGTLQVGNGGTSGSLLGPVADNATLAFNRQDAVTFAGAISGTGSLAQTGTGTLTLTGANTYTGGTTIASGTLQVGNGGATGSILGNVTDNAALAFNRQDAVTFAGAISGTGSLAQTGTGTLTLTGANTYTGGTTVSAGTVAITQSTALGTGAITLNPGTTLAFAAPDLTLANAIVFGAALDPTIDTGANDATIAGVISGPGALTKLGTGTLDLTAIDTYTGATTVAAGTLLVDGSIANSTVTVDSGASLGGTGAIGGLVALAGATIAPGAVTPYSTLTVGGGLTFQPGSTAQIQIDAAGRTDLIAANGTAALNGGTVDIVANGTGFSAASRYTFLTAAGGVTGEFTSLVNSTNLAFLNPTLTYSADAVTLALQANGVTFADVAETPNQRAVALAAQGLGANSTVFSTLQGLTADQTRGALDSLAGAAHSSVVTAATRDAERVATLLFDRLWTIGGGEIDARTLLQQMQAPSPLPTYVNCFAAAPPRPAPPTVYTVWGEGFGDFGHDGGNQNQAGLDRSLGGFVLGADAPIHGFGAPIRVGVAGGYSNDQFTSIGPGGAGSRGSFESVFGAVYAGARYGAVDMRLGISVAGNSTAMNRYVSYPGLFERERSVYGGETVQTFGELGYRFTGTRWIFEPVADAAYTYVHQDAFSERGGPAALLGYAQDNGVETTTLGARAEYAPFAGLPLVARGLLGWRHTYGDIDPAARLAFEAGSIPFTSQGAPIERDALAAEAGLDWRYSTAVTMGVSYIGQVGAHDTDTGIKGRFEYRF